MPTVLITPPAVEPISLADMRAQCRVAPDDTAEDALLAIYIQAARESAEHILGRALINQTWEQTLDAFPAGEIRLDKSAAQTIVSVQYTDPSGAVQTLAPTAYTLDATQAPGWLLPSAGTSWPATAATINAVRIRYVAGYGETSASVPAAVRQWLLVTAAAYYAQREAIDSTGRVAALPERFIDRLLDAERVYA